MKKVAISGYFDPIHIGHLEYIKLARELGDYLIVIVNNDKQAYLKKGKSFMCEDDRLQIVSQIKGVDKAVMSIDEDKTVCKTLDFIKPDIFANGGDRSNSEIPEFKICKENGTQVMDGLGNKIRSSSDLTGIK
jgi:cytidyltransferase-like protein